jgi:hypothetical protein
MLTRSSEKRSAKSTTSSYTKRPRVSDDSGISALDVYTTATLSGLPTDCQLRILSFLGNAENLASTAQVSRNLCEACRHPSLPQTHTAMVTCGTKKLQEGNTFVSLLKMLVSMQKSGKFSQFTKLKLINVSLLDKISLKKVPKIAPRLRLRDVTALDLSGTEDQLPSTQSLECKWVKALLFIMPNIREIDFSNGPFQRVVYKLLPEVGKRCKCLERITWNGQHDSTMLVACHFFRTLQNLKELYIDNAIWIGSGRQQESPESFYAEADCILMGCNSKLERVSLKNAQDRTSIYDRITRRWSYPEAPLAQSALVKFVRMTPNLRWFRSDLTSENLTLLQTERPEITFA